MSDRPPLRFELPQELIDVIIDCVRDDSPPDLLSLGLVSSAWYRRTRYHLFHEVEFSVHSAWRCRCDELKSLLEAKPTLAKYIAKLTIEDISEDEEPWFLSCQSLAGLLPLLKHLEDVFLCDIDWARLSPALSIAFYNTIASPTVRALTLNCVDNIDVSFLAKCHHVESFTFDEVTAASANPIQQISPPCTLPCPDPMQDSRRSPRSLSIGACGNFLKNLITYSPSSEHALNFFQLRQLTIWGDDTFDEAMKEVWPVLLDFCGETVATFGIQQQAPLADNADLSSQASWAPPDSIFSFARFPHLEHLHMDLSCHYLSFDNFHNFKALASALDRISKFEIPSRLTSVELVIHFKKWSLDTNEEVEGLDVGTDLDNLSSCETWVALSNFLTRPAFPELHAFQVALDIFSCASVSEERKRSVLTNIQSRIAGFEKQGVIVDIEFQLDLE